MSLVTQGLGIGGAAVAPPTTGAVLFGMNSKIYAGAAGATLSALTEIVNVQNVNVNLGADELESTARSNAKWFAAKAGLRKCTVEITAIATDGDAVIDDLRDAYLTRTTRELAVLDQAREITGAQGPKGAFAITEFSRSEALDDAILITLTAVLASWSEWVEV